MGPEAVLEMRHSPRTSCSAASGLFLHIRLAVVDVSLACFTAMVEEEKPMKGI